MILFKPEHVAPILAGRKTETRRLGEKRWNVGAVHQCRTAMFGEPFAHVRILDVWREWLRDLTIEGAHAEGYRSVLEYRRAFYSINRQPKHLSDGEWANPLVWVVRFEVDQTKLRHAFSDIVAGSTA